LIIQGKDSPELIGVQNSIGKIHDLENLQSLVGKNKWIENEIQHDLKKLRKKSPDLVLKINKQFCKYIYTKSL
jgi:hypothetical protein